MYDHNSIDPKVYTKVSIWQDNTKQGNEGIQYVEKEYRNHGSQKIRSYKLNQNLAEKPSCSPSFTFYFYFEPEWLSPFLTKADLSSNDPFQSWNARTLEYFRWTLFPRKKLWLQDFFNIIYKRSSKGIDRKIHRFDGMRGQAIKPFVPKMDVISLLAQMKLAELKTFPKIAKFQKYSDETEIIEKNDYTIYLITLLFSSILVSGGVYLLIEKSLAYSVILGNLSTILGAIFLSLLLVAGYFLPELRSTLKIKMNNHTGNFNVNTRWQARLTTEEDEYDEDSMNHP